MHSNHLTTSLLSTVEQSGEVCDKIPGTGSKSPKNKKHSTRHRSHLHQQPPLPEVEHNWEVVELQGSLEDPQAAVPSPSY